MRPFLTPPFLSPRDGKDFAYFFKQNLFLLARLADTAGTRYAESNLIKLSFFSKISRSHLILPIGSRDEQEMR